MFIIPHVIEETAQGTRGYDIFSRLLEERNVYLNGEVNDEVAAVIEAQLLYLDSKEPGKDIHLYINSPGGLVTAGFKIYDTMEYIHSDVVTIVNGMAASMGAFLLSSGAKGKRLALPHSIIMIHQPLGGARGQVSDVEIQAQFLVRIKKELTQILSENTGQPYQKVFDDTDRDRYLSAPEALEYGLIDRIIRKREA